MALVQEAPSASILTAQRIGWAAFDLTPGALHHSASDPTATLRGRLDPGGDVDVVRLWLAAGDRLVLDLDGAAPGLDARLDLRDGGANLLGASDDAPPDPGSASAADPWLSFTAAEAGFVFVSLSAAAGNGAYALHMTIANPLRRFGTEGADQLTGTAGPDTLAGGEGADTLSGGSGDDLLEGGGGADSLQGGEGADRLLGGAGNDILLGGPGADLLEGGEGADTLAGGGGGPDTLLGGLGADSLAGGAAEGNLLLGGDGNDTLLGGMAAGGQLLGGAGDDLLLDEDGLADMLAGGEGADSLGGDMLDRLLGGEGNDRVALAAAGDLFLGTGFADGGEGVDRLAFEPLRDGANLGFELGALDFDAAAGRLSYAGNGAWIAPARLDFSGFESFAVTGGLAGDRLVGGAGGDSLSGGDGADLLRGEGGDDTLRSGAGPGDVLLGGAGRDLLFLEVWTGALLDGGSGNDTIRAMDGTGGVLLGGSGNDDIRLGTGRFTADGEGGQDRLMLDWFSLGPAQGITSWLEADGSGVVEAGAFRLEHAGFERFVLRGGAGEDWLQGGAGPDSLEGGAGSDSLLGGAGADTLVGGAGADVFLLREGSATGRDVVVDFQRGLDLIQLDLDADRLAPGMQGFTWIGTAAFTTGLPGQLRLGTGPDGWALLQAMLDGDGLPDLEILVRGARTLGPEDLWFP